MITSIIRQALGTVSPRALAILRAVRSRRRSTRFERTIGATGAAQKIADNVGLEVQRGPFRGMHFPETLRQRGIGSKLLGTYEHELYDFVAGAIAHAPDR
ncbi:MAG: hypothetical protein ABMA01_11180, partial [Chthoniobacteraceae bacterium]